MQADANGWIDHSRLSTIQSQIARLKKPTTKQSDRTFQLINHIAALEICRDPNGEPYTRDNLLSIADGTLDWRTGKRIDS